MKAQNHKTESEFKKKRPELNVNATNHSYPLPFPPNYTLENPSSAHFYQNNLAGLRLKYSFEIALDKPMYPHYSCPLQSEGLPSKQPFSFWRTLLLRITAKVSIIQGSMIIG